MKTVAMLGAVLAVTVCPAALTGAQKSAIDRITAAKGTFAADEDVYQVTFPRTEVKVRVDGWSMPPFMGITSWAAFTPAGGERLMVMGDLALFPDEVNPVMSAVVDSGLAVTALHNHFSCRALSSPTTCRFIPALAVPGCLSSPVSHSGVAHRAMAPTVTT